MNDASSKSSNTWNELVSQPTVWREWADELAEVVGSVGQWIDARDPDEIWLCGAGSSAFIGQVIATGLGGRSPRPLRAVASTDLVACPHDFLRPDIRPLVVSFGRSGDSTESVGTLDLLDVRAPQADRLNITCHREGTLATRGPGEGVQGEQRVILLPDSTCDAGFAMTASFTTMLLTALACLDPDARGQAADRMRALADAAETLLLDDDAGAPVPARAVFLGSGALQGCGREAALKVLELSAGRIVAAWDSPLGFRHGPKSLVDTNTRTYVLVSSHPLTRRYDLDLVAELERQFGAGSVVTIGPADADVSLTTVVDDVWSAVLYLLVAQRLAVRWSEALGIDVDDPFAARGHLTRVVSGVTLHV